MHSYYGRKPFAPRRIPVRQTEQRQRPQQETEIRPAVETPPKSDPVTNGKVEPATVDDTTKPAAEEIDWRAQASRLQAEMDNFRKRQTRLAEERIEAERVRLLAHFLPVIDNLERALNHDQQSLETLRQGLNLTHQEFKHLLQKEGVTRLETIGQPLDPTQHEALATQPSAAESGTIIDEIEAGYTLQDRLLRPARVIVAD